VIMEQKDSQEIRDRMHLVLRGPDGEIKDERNIDSQEDSDGTDEGHGIQEPTGD